MNRYTPGPWRAGPGGRILAPEPQTVLVCRVGAYDDPELLPYCRERWQADAQMIAAAPELLAALEGLTEGPLSLNELNELMADAREVIAKAKGEKE